MVPAEVKMVLLSTSFHKEEDVKSDCMTFHFFGIEHIIQRMN